jgi:hypothetical protein
LISRGHTRAFTDQREYDALIVALRERIGCGAVEVLRDEGAAWSEHDALVEATRI